MCEFCTNDANELRVARANARRLAERLEGLATHYRRLASGDLQPHSDEMKVTTQSALSVIRTLVDDWV